jgi:hypothetical protein
MANNATLAGHVHIDDYAIMRDVDADHEGAVVADPRHHAAARRAGIDRHLLADDVVAADLEPRLLALVLEILRNVADRSEREDARAVADRGAAGDGNVRDQLDALAELDLGADHAERPDHRGGGERGARLDDGRRMDLRHTVAQLSRIIAAKVASATSLSPTVARASNFHTMPRWRWQVTGTRMTSPGTTGRRKRALSIDMK